MDFLLPDRPFLIAEAGVNHNGKTELALKLVDAAAEAGADAVKFQTFRADTLVTAEAPKAQYQKRGRAGASSQKKMLKNLELSPAAHREIFKRCRQRGILFLSTPFDESCADFLDKLGMALFKIPSGELTNLELLAHIARKQKPVILSTGMGTLAEVAAAVSALRKAGTRDLVLLHCVSSYPAPSDQSNLRAMATMAQAFSAPVGYSDHTPGATVAIAAAALGARVIEKHFTLDKALPGPDHAMSLNVKELKSFVLAVRAAAAALGDGIKAPRPCEEEILRVARRSVVLNRSSAAGTVLSRELLALKRPGTGIAPGKIDEVIGKRLLRAAKADTLLSWEMLA